MGQNAEHGDSGTMFHPNPCLRSRDKAPLGSWRIKGARKSLSKVVVRTTWRFRVIYP